MILVYRSHTSTYASKQIIARAGGFLTKINRRRRAYKLEPIDAIPDGLGLMKL
jgi:hypothetical protein